MAAAGKVLTGFSLPYVAVYAVNNGTISYTNGQKLARGVSVTINAESSDNNIFYADNQSAETAGGRFTSGTAELTVDGLFIAAERLIMGLPEASADGFTAYGDDQELPYIGIGFVARYMSGDVTTYTPYVLPKTSFNQIGLEASTQGEEIDWQTQALTANILRADDAKHRWKYVGGDLETEAAAEAKIKAFFGIAD